MSIREIIIFELLPLKLIFHISSTILLPFQHSFVRDCYDYSVKVTVIMRFIKLSKIISEAVSSELRPSENKVSLHRNQTVNNDFPTNVSHYIDKQVE